MNFDSMGSVLLHEDYRCRSCDHDRLLLFYMYLTEYLVLVKMRSMYNIFSLKHVLLLTALVKLSL